MNQLETELDELNSQHQTKIDAVRESEKNTQAQLEEAKSQLSVFRERAVSQVTDMQSELSSLKQQLSQAQQSEKDALDHLESIQIIRIFAIIRSYLQACSS